MIVEAFIQFTFRKLLYLIILHAIINSSLFWTYINQAIIIPVFFAI